MRNQIAGISEKMLTQRLKELEEEGLIVRNDFKTVPPRVEYSLTEAGQLLVPILDQLSDWGDTVRPLMKEHR